MMFNIALVWTGLPCAFTLAKGKNFISYKIGYLNISCQCFMADVLNEDIGDNIC